MRTRTLRHVVPDTSQHGTKTSSVDASILAAKPIELTWHDYLIMLLHVGAELEHALMVEYLYAAYSLGGDQVPAKHRPMVERWRQTILTIAREEMGHLITVQNLLVLLGGSINLDRDDYPWDSPFYPFPFRLEPLTLDSLSLYVYAEMPQNMRTPSGKDAGGKHYKEFEKEDRARIVKAVREYCTRNNTTPHEVGEIYDRIIEIVADPKKIPDSAFQGDTLPVQASWDEWGRGYKPGPVLLDAEGNKLAGPAWAREPRVIVDQVCTRTQAVATLKAIGGQGEALHIGDPSDEPSHFDRFLEIYQEFEKVKGWKPARDVPVNPTTVPPSATSKAGTYIEHETSRLWASLFNLRYRMLLSFLAHSFRLARTMPPDIPSVRGAVMHRVFGEMYNIKTIANIVMRSPLRDPKSKSVKDLPRFAGPPFEMPYSLALPPDVDDCWRLHQDMYVSAKHIIDRLRPHATGATRDFLLTLRDIDEQAMQWIDGLLFGLGAVGRYRP